MDELTLADWLLIVGAGLGVGSGVALLKRRPDLALVCFVVAGLCVAAFLRKLAL